MKRVTVFTFFLILFFGFQSGWAETDFHFKLPNILDSFGLGVKTNISVTNNTQLNFELVALDHKIGVLTPGGSFYESYGFEFDRTELPLIAFFYNVDDFVGIATKVMSIRKGQSNHWIVQSSDIKYVDGRNYSNNGFCGSALPASQLANPISQEVDFPRIGYKSMIAIQFVNATNFTAFIKIDGELNCILEKGQYKYGSVSDPVHGNVRYNVEVVFSDNDRLIGTYQGSYSTSSNPKGVQFVLTPDKIRRN